MRFAPPAGPSQLELDRVKRVLFPVDDNDEDDDEDEEYHSLPLTGEGTKSQIPVEEEEEEEEMSGVKKRLKLSKSGAGDVRIDSVFKLDPNIEIFRGKTPPSLAIARADATADSTSAVADAVFATVDVTSAAAVASGVSPSPSRRRFDPPFKTPPATAIGAQLAGPASFSPARAALQVEETPPFKTPPKSPPAPPSGKGKRRLFTNKSELVEELPSPRKKDNGSSQLSEWFLAEPASKLKLLPTAEERRLSSSSKSGEAEPTKGRTAKATAKLKAAKPKKEKRETAKDRAEAYRVSHREKILRDMEKHKREMEQLLEKRRQRRSLQPSPESEDDEEEG